jgi:hypothetical protein
MTIEEYHDDKREFEDIEPCDDDMFYHDEDHEPHGLDCDCPDCSLEHAMSECGQLPQRLGGGCTMAGTEFCDFECPLRDEPEDSDDQDPDEEEE